MDNVRGKNTKRKHLSKNKKKSWRKVDINDIEEFLEDERLQERTGGKVAEKTDESLYFVDKKTLKPADNRIARKRKAQEKLRDIEVALKPPPPKKKDHRAPAVIEKEEAGIVSATQKHALKQRKKARDQRNHRVRTRVKLPVAQYDLWGDKLESEFAGEDEYYLQATKRSRVKVPARLRNPVSLVPAVEAPHPGTSYNPTYDEYQDLLEQANSKEMKRLKQEERIRRALDEKFPSVKSAPNEKSHLEEMSAGLFDKEEEEPETGDLDKLSVNPPVRRENKKDERKRKKEKALKDQAKLAEKLKQKRIKDNSFFRLRSIKSEIKQHEQELQSRAQKRAADKARDLYRTKKLSKTKFEEPDLPLKLSDELVGSLRELKPEGNLLVDRFQSLMKRNILEVRGTRGKKQKRRFKPKVFEKKSHKEIK